MKVLLLGSGNWYVKNKLHPYYQPCPTYDEYNYCITTAQEEGTLVRLDMDPTMEPDILCCVHEPWADKVMEKFQGDFDVIIDEITSTECGYLGEVEKLLSPDGIFYGWKDHKKVKWFNTSTGLMLVED